MNVPQDTLNGWRETCSSLRGQLNALRREIVTGRREQARDRLLEVDDAVRVLGLSMERAGAERAAHKPPRPIVPLTLLDTPANRLYADALRVAWEAGLVVDRERYGESIGTDGPAQMIETVLANVEQELHGPAGAGE